MLDTIKIIIKNNSIIKDSLIKKVSLLLFTALFLAACTSTTTISEDSSSSITKNKTNLKEASKLNTELAVGYIQREQYTPAKEKLEKAIEQNPGNYKAYKIFAYLYALLGLTDKADEKYKQALELAPEDPDLLNSYGAFLCQHDRLEDAQENFKIAYSNPFYENRYLAQSNAGSCYVMQGEYKKAEPLLRESLRIQPKLPGSLISMAEVGVKTQRYLMARAYIQRYHQIKPANAESLWVEFQSEKALGAKDQYLKAARKLIKDFPDSDQAGWAEAEVRNEQLR